MTVWKYFPFYSCNFLHFSCLSILLTQKENKRCKEYMSLFLPGFHSFDNIPLSRPVQTLLVYVVSIPNLHPEKRIQGLLRICFSPLFYITGIKTFFFAVCVYSVVYMVQENQIRGLHVPGKYYIYIYFSLSLSMYNIHTPWVLLLHIHVCMCIHIIYIPSVLLGVLLKYE